MKILVVDDGQLAINSLIRILCRVAPDCDYISAMTTDDALTWMRQGPMDAAFLNLEMPGMNGLALARMIQKLQPRCNIIVVTEHPEYALEALQIFVSGFLLKPANEADVRNVLENLRYPPETAPVGIKIQCFGNFEIFVGGRPLSFKRSKSKELLAYLVDRNGATCTNGEMLAVLWEDKPDTASLHSHLRNLIFDLSHTLEDAGVNGLLVRGRSTLALDTSKVDCDYYNFLRGDRSAFNAYRGEYMTQYSWAEVTRSALRQQAAATPKSGSIPSYYVPPTGFKNCIKHQRLLRKRCAAAFIILLKSFQFQQIFLDLQSLGVAGQAAVCADDPVARHHDAQRVAVAGAAHGAACLGFAQRRRQLAVGAHLPVGNLVQLRPYRLLKGRALCCQRQVELPAHPGKIFVQLLLCLLQQGRFHHPAWQRLQLRRTVRAKMYPAQCVVFLLQTDGTKDAVDVPDVQNRPLPFL